MLDEIRESLKHNIQEVSWMDSETKKAAVSKADAITDMIGTKDQFAMLHLVYNKISRFP
jgi:predicted metalloendopeptidase